jgi:hypothetical protein
MPRQEQPPGARLARATATWAAAALVQGAAGSVLPDDSRARLETESACRHAASHDGRARAATGVQAGRPLPSWPCGRAGTRPAQPPAQAAGTHRVADLARSGRPARQVGRRQSAAAPQNADTRCSAASPGSAEGHHRRDTGQRVRVARRAAPHASRQHHRQAGSLREAHFARRAAEAPGSAGTVAEPPGPAGNQYRPRTAREACVAPPAEPLGLAGSHRPGAGIPDPAGPWVVDRGRPAEGEDDRRLWRCQHPRRNSRDAPRESNAPQRRIHRHWRPHPRHGDPPYAFRRAVCRQLSSG